MIKYICILLLIPFLSYSQESKFHIGIELNPGKSDRRLISNDATADIAKEVFSKIEKKTFGYDAGVIIEYQINEKFRLQSGVKYVRWGYESDKRYFFTGIPDPNNPNPNPSPSIPEAVKNEGENTYVEIPLSLSYYLNTKHASLFFMLGSSMTYNLKNTNKMISFYFDRTEEMEIEDEVVTFRKINFVHQIGIGLERAINSSFSVFMMPNFKIQAFGIAKDVPLNRRLFFYGLSFGVKIK